MTNRWATSERGESVFAMRASKSWNGIERQVRRVEVLDRNTARVVCISELELGQQFDHRRVSRDLLVDNFGSHQYAL